MRMILLACLMSFALTPVAFSQVRTVTAQPDAILTIKTGLGIATIVQAPETIQSAVIGDQSGFKVEYLDRAVTIKPLRFGAKTNLYLVTEKRRYNLRLLTLGQETADYIVYIKSAEDQPKAKWVLVNRFGAAGWIKVSVNRIGSSADGFILLDAKITTSSPVEHSLRPEQFWVLQGNSSKVINGLFISSLVLSKSKPVLLGISLAKSDLIPRQPITLELRGKEKVSIVIPEALLWR